MNIFKSKYNIGDIVYIKTDEEQMPCIIIEITFRQNGECYTIKRGIEDMYVYALEITPVKNELIHFIL